MQLTTNFNLAEFECRDGSSPPPELAPRLELLAVQLQILRDLIGAPIRIVSGYRSPEYNATLKASKPTSQHVQARAADIRADGVDVEELATICDELQESGRWIMGGLGVYPGPSGFVHVDTRGTKARWRG